MQTKPVYLWYRRMKTKQPQGQIAAVMTIIIAIIFLFVAITINIGRVSRYKTAATIAADGAGLSLASGLGSFGYVLSEMYVDGKTHDCNFNIMSLIGIILIIIGVILELLNVKGAGYMIAAGGFTLLNWNIIVYPSLVNTFNRNMSEMTAEQAFHETAIAYAFFRIVDDPALVVDINDYDEDGRADDKIPRFMAWYAWRTYWIAESVDALKSAIEDLKWWVNAFLTDDCEVFRAYIDGGYNWPEDPDGVMANLLREIEAGVEYDAISSRVWNQYEQSGTNVYDRNVTILQLASNPYEVQYDFTDSFWVDGSNPDDENDPVNDEVDFFLQDLQEFREWCINDEYHDCVQQCRIDNPPTRDDDNAYTECVIQNCPKGWLQEDVDALASTVDFWYSDLQNWIEGTLYEWRRNGGPLQRWRNELLNWNASRFNGSVQREFNQAITGLGYQLQNNRGHYLGGLYTVRDSRVDPPWSAAELDHLNSLIAAIEEDLETLKDYASSENPYYVENPRSYQKNLHYAAYQIERWRIKYGELRANAWNPFVNLYNMIKHPGYAEYDWTDTLGHHYIRVDVTINPYHPRDYDTVIPTVDAYSRSLGFERCYDLKNYRGHVDVTVTRRDTPQDPQEINLAQRLLWRFTSPEIVSSSRTHYDIDRDDIYITR